MNLIKQSILIYCVKCRKKIKNLDPNILETKYYRLIMQLEFSVCGIKKLRFVKEQEAEVLF